MAVRVQPGPAGTQASRRRAEELQVLRDRELDAVRAQADKWRTGLSSLVGVGTVVAAIWGPSRGPAGSGGLRVLVGVLLLLAVCASAVGAFVAMRAAYGFPARRQAEATLDELIARTQSRLRRSCTDLRRTVVLAYASLVLLVAALAVAWFG